MAEKPKSPLNDILALPDEQRKEFLSDLPEEVRRGMYEEMGAKDSGYTLGQRYQFQRDAGLLPKSTKTSFGTNPAQALSEAATAAGEQSQEYFNRAQGGRFEEGKQIAPPSKGRFLINDIMGELYGGAEVGAKLAGAFTDPKTVAAFVVSKLGPYGALAAAQYFGYQSTQGLSEAIHSGKITPENLQNGLLATAGIAGAGAMGSEAPKTKGVTPADIKARLQPFARKITGAEPATREAVTNAIEKFDKDKAKNAVDRKKVQEENEMARKQSRFRAGEEEYKRAKTNREIAEENARKQQEFENSKAQRTEAQRQVETQAKTAKTQIESVENKVWQEANRKFDAVKQAIGADRPGEPTLPPTPLLEAVTAGQTVLRGIPESLTLFKQVLKLEGEGAGELSQLRQQVMQGQGMSGDYANLRPEQQALVDEIANRYGGSLTEGDPVNWGKLQRIKTAADTALRSRNTPAIVKESLRPVRDAVVNMMGQMAESKGVTAEWQDANNFYRQWREDFHTSTGPQGSASPIAQTLDAVDPYSITRNLKRTEGATGNRAIDILNKYPQFGGTEAANTVRGMLDVEKGIGKEPKPPIAKSPKPEPTVSNLEPQKEVPPETETPTVDVTEVSRKALEQRAKNWGSFNARDIGILSSSVVGPIIYLIFRGVEGTAGEVGRGSSALFPTAAISYEGGKYLGSRALVNPKVISWLEKVPPEEMAALRKIPGADRIKIVNGITEQAVASFKDMGYDAGSDNSAWDRAKAELGPDAKLSDISARATKYNQDAIAQRAKSFKNQKAGNAAPVVLSPEVKAFLGPENVAKILAAAGNRQQKKPVQNRAEAVQALQQ